MSLPHVPGEVVHGDVLVTVRTPRLLSQVDALNVIIQQLLSLELLLAVATLVVTDLLVEILDVVVEVLVLLVADVACRGLGEMNLSDVVLESVLGDELLLAEGALSDLREKIKTMENLLIEVLTLLWQCSFSICHLRLPAGKDWLHNWHWTFSPCSRMSLFFLLGLGFTSTLASSSSARIAESSIEESPLVVSSVLS